MYGVNNGSLACTRNRAVVPSTNVKTNDNCDTRRDYFHRHIPLQKLKIKFNPKSTLNFDPLHRQVPFWYDTIIHCQKNYYYYYIYEKNYDRIII